MASVGFPVCAALVAPPPPEQVVKTKTISAAAWLLTHHIQFTCFIVQVSETGGADRRPRCSPAPTGEHTGSEGRSNQRGPGSDEGSGEAESKRMRRDG